MREPGEKSFFGALVRFLRLLTGRWPLRDEVIISLFAPLSILRRSGLFVNEPPFSVSDGKKRKKEEDESKKTRKRSRVERGTHTNRALGLLLVPPLRGNPPPHLHHAGGYMPVDI